MKLPKIFFFLFLAVFCRPNVFFSMDTGSLNVNARKTGESGKVPPGIAKQMEERGSAEILLNLDAAQIREKAKKMREQRGVRNDDAEIIAEKARLYANMKNAVLSKISSKAYSVIKDYAHFPILHMTVNERVLDQLLHMAEVESVTENSTVIPHLAESLPLINTPGTQSAGATGSGTSVAVLDTGVNYTLSAFGSCTVPGVPSSCKVAYVQDFAPDDGSLDDSGHGTNVSGIVLGVAPDANILGLDVFELDGRAHYDVIVSALDWVLDNRITYNIQSVNMSFGEGRYSLACPAHSVALSIRDLKDAGITSAVSSGNDGYLDSLAAPACAPDAVSVGAVYDANVGSMLYSSCTDTTTAPDKVTCFSNSSALLTMLAPGALITSTGSTMAGTSQAAPHVAGAVAVIKGQDGTLTVNEVVTRLTVKGEPVTDSRNSIVKPRLDLYASVFPGPLIAFTPSSFFFDVISGGALPPSRSLSVSNAGDGTLNWTVSDDASWLSLDPLSGVNSGVVTVGASTSVLSAGTYTATITITSSDASNSPRTIPVSLFVYDASAQLEGFESGSLSSLGWTTGGAGTWGTQSSTSSSGTYAVKSPSMGNNSTSYLEVTMNTCSPGYVYFWLKTSTEARWDKLNFYIDDSDAGRWDGWHGETDWTRAQSTFAASPGLHTFRWEYSKDYLLFGGSDAVWLDNIVFPSFNPPVKLPSQYFWAAQTAYNAAVDGDVLRLQEYPFSENLVLNRNISVTLKGGYDCSYSSNPEFATINGTVTISDGTVIVENLVIK